MTFVISNIVILDKQRFHSSYHCEERTNVKLSTLACIERRPARRRPHVSDATISAEPRLLRGDRVSVVSLAGRAGRRQRGVHQVCIYLLLS